MNIEQINEILQNNDCVIVHFSSPHCGICHSLKPKFVDLKTEYKDLQVLEIDITTSMEITSYYSVFTAPTVIVFLYGRESGRFSRSFGIGQISKTIDRFYEITKNS